MYWARSLLVYMMDKQSNELSFISQVGQVYNSVSAGICVLSSDCRIVFVNSELVQLLDISKANIIGQDFLSIIFSDADNDKLKFRAWFKSLLCRSKQNKSPEKFSCELISNSNRKVAAVLSAKKISHLEHEFIVITFDELAEFVSKDSHMLALQEQFISILSSIPDLLVVLDEQGIFCDVFTSKPELLYKPVERLIGRSFHDIMPAELAPKIAATLDKVFTTKQVQSVEYALEVSGKFRWFSASVIPFKNHSEVRVLWLARDVTPLLQAQTDAQSSLRFMESLLKALPDPVYYKDTAGKYLGCNDAFENIVGKSIREIRGATDQDLWPTEQAELFALKDAELASETGTQYFEHAIENATGQKRNIIFSKATYYDANDHVAGIVGVMTDISARREIERQKRSLQKQMLEAQKLESLGVLAGGIAHYFNNQLVGIIGNADLAMLELQADHPCVNYIKQVQNSAIKAAELTDQMRAYSGAGHFVVQSENINDIIHETYHLLESCIKQGAELVLKLQPNLPDFKVDRNQIQQVLINLVSNASEAIINPAGTVTLTTHLFNIDTDQKITGLVAGEPIPGSYICIEVADTGVGIASKTKQKLFEPFFSTKFTGRGLGLAATHGIVRGHKGLICLESAKNIGSKFKILFPAAKS